MIFIWRKTQKNKSDFFTKPILYLVHYRGELIFHLLGGGELFLNESLFHINIVQETFFKVLFSYELEALKK